MLSKLLAMESRLNMFRFSGISYSKTIDFKDFYDIAEVAKLFNLPISSSFYLKP
jgi:hypothetical protein